MVASMAGERLVLMVAKVVINFLRALMTDQEDQLSPIDSSNGYCSMNLPPHHHYHSHLPPFPYARQFSGAASPSHARQRLR